MIIAAAVNFVFLTGVVLGLELTVWTVMLFALPVIFVFGLITIWLQSRL